MIKQDIENLMNAFKNDSEIQNIFGNRISYESFHSDQAGLGMLIQILGHKKKDCRKKELMQIQIIDKKDASTSLEMKGYMDKIDSFLNSRLKNFDGFQTLAVGDNGDEKLLKNNKDRFVFTKRYTIVY